MLKRPEIVRSWPFWTTIKNTNYLELQKHRVEAFQQLPFRIVVKTDPHQLVAVGATQREIDSLWDWIHKELVPSVDGEKDLSLKDKLKYLIIKFQLLVLEATEIQSQRNTEKVSSPKTDEIQENETLPTKETPQENGNATVNDVKIQETEEQTPQDNEEHRLEDEQAQEKDEQSPQAQGNDVQTQEKDKQSPQNESTPNGDMKSASKSKKKKKKGKECCNARKI